MTKVFARVLVNLVDNGNLLEPNELCEGESALIKELEAAGKVDANKAAVAYCKEIGANAIAIVGNGLNAAAKANADKEKAIAEARATLADAQADLETAPDANKEAAQKAVDAAQTALDALNNT